MPNPSRPVRVSTTVTYDFFMMFSLLSVLNCSLSITAVVRFYFTNVSRTAVGECFSERMSVRRSDKRRDAGGMSFDCQNARLQHLCDCGIVHFRIAVHSILQSR